MLYPDYGMGGGTILVLVLSNFLNINQHIAQATNLIYFIPTSIAAIWVYLKNGNLNKKIALKMIPCGIVFRDFWFVYCYFNTSSKFKEIFWHFFTSGWRV